LGFRLDWLLACNLSLLVGVGSLLFSECLFALCGDVADGDVLAGDVARAEEVGPREESDPGFLRELAVLSRFAFGELLAPFGFDSPDLEFDSSRRLPFSAIAFSVTARTSRSVSESESISDSCELLGFFLVSRFGMPLGRGDGKTGASQGEEGSEKEVGGSEG
jgi:hypothetical protein